MKTGMKLNGGIKLNTGMKLNIALMEMKAQITETKLLQSCKSHDHQWIDYAMV